MRIIKFTDLRRNYWGADLAEKLTVKINPPNKKGFRPSHRREKQPAGYANFVFMRDGEPADACTIHLYFSPSGAVSCCLWVRPADNYEWYTSSAAEPSNNTSFGYNKTASVIASAFAASGLSVLEKDGRNGAWRLQGDAAYTIAAIQEALLLMHGDSIKSGFWVVTGGWI